MHGDCRKKESAIGYSKFERSLKPKDTGYVMQACGGIGDQ